MQTWLDNLPILNEWKRRYPDQDPWKCTSRCGRFGWSSGRRQIRLERKVADDGIDRLRPPGRAEVRPRVRPPP